MRCYACGEVRPVDDFPRDRTKASGRMSICRTCDNAQRSARYAAAEKSLKPPKPCKVCGLPVAARRWYCDMCRPRRLRQRERARERGRIRLTPTERGYGTAHQKMRKTVARLVESGEARCARCFELIAPDEPWDLGHDDVDRSVYSGPEHRACNRATASRRVERRLMSREW